MSVYLAQAFPYNSLAPHETYGLDFESADDCTPKWYSVSSGNGNDGVSRMYPDYHVRTHNPYDLAMCAMVSQFKPEYQAKVWDETFSDGETEFGISATLLDPPDWSPELDHSQCEEGEDCEGCSECESDESWSDSNGAYAIIEVYPVDDDFDAAHTRRQTFESLREAFGAEIVSMCCEES